MGLGGIGNGVGVGVGGGGCKFITIRCDNWSYLNIFLVKFRWQSFNTKCTKRISINGVLKIRNTSFNYSS